MYATRTFFGSPLAPFANAALTQPGLLAPFSGRWLPDTGAIELAQAAIFESRRRPNVHLAHKSLSFCSAIEAPTQREEIPGSAMSVIGVKGDAWVRTQTRRVATDRCLCAIVPAHKPP